MNGVGATVQCVAIPCAECEAAATVYIYTVCTLTLSVHPCAAPQYANVLVQCVSMCMLHSVQTNLHSLQMYLQSVQLLQCAPMCSCTVCNHVNCAVCKHTCTVCKRTPICSCTLCKRTCTVFKKGVLAPCLTHDILKNGPKNDHNQKVIGSKN